MLLIPAAVLAVVVFSSGSPVSEKDSDKSNSLEGKHHFPSGFYQRAYELLQTSRDFANLTLEDVTHLADSVEEWEAPRDIAQRFPYYLSGHDYEERPIWITEFGKYAIRQTMENYPNATGVIEQMWLQAVIRIFKSMNRNPDGSASEEVKQYEVVIDADKLDILQVAHLPTMRLALKILRKYLDMLVIGLHHVTIINANYAAEMLLNVIRPILGNFFERVEIYGGNKVKWTGALRRLYPSQAYPPWYGGSADWKPVEVYG